RLRGQFPWPLHDDRRVFIRAAISIGIRSVRAGLRLDSVRQRRSARGGYYTQYGSLPRRTDPGRGRHRRAASGLPRRMRAHLPQALLGGPQATFASKIELAGQGAKVTREGDGGLETVSIKLPAVITTDLRLNEPRYVTLPNIMKAKKKTLEALKPEALGVAVSPRLATLKVVEPPKRKAGVKVPDAKALLEKLRNEAKVH